jgi:hypothetical protein
VRLWTGRLPTRNIRHRRRSAVIWKFGTTIC